ncbi:Radial spoke head protein 6-like protein A-like [Oopsacas minuta]|uniref:Radial spoke head protein 6-like protein A-like n=1 Tax=Oopsacas minuta TaxID=111878 RepID=A0AAV7KF64_9METZ|nr:Radial spoke head protein 6-like protein A-like [Oopsacas minuta]
MSNPQDEFDKARAYLLTSSDVSNINLYDHLSTCLKKVLLERPNNAVDYIEDISRKIKREKLTAKTDSLVNEPGANSEAVLAEVHRGLFTPPAGDEQERLGEDDALPPYPNLLELIGYLEQGGIGVGKTEAFRIFLALKQLTESHKLQSVRFWG